MRLFNIARNSIRVLARLQPRQDSVIPSQHSRSVAPASVEDLVTVVDQASARPEQFQPAPLGSARAAWAQAAWVQAARDSARQRIKLIRRTLEQVTGAVQSRRRWDRKEANPRRARQLQALSSRRPPMLFMVLAVSSAASAALRLALSATGKAKRAHYPRTFQVT